MYWKNCSTQLSTGPWIPSATWERQTHSYRQTHSFTLFWKWWWCRSKAVSEHAMLKSGVTATVYQMNSVWLHFNLASASASVPLLFWRCLASAGGGGCDWGHESPHIATSSPCRGIFSLKMRHAHMKNTPEPKIAMLVVLNGERFRRFQCSFSLISS